MKAVILAAGKGKRMRGLCAATPKPMLPIANRPILSASFARLRTMGVDEVALVVGFEGQQLQNLVGDGSQFGMHITYVWQKEQLGTGHAALICEDFVAGDTFVLIFGDILTRTDNYSAMAKRFRDGGCDGLLTVFPVEDPSNGAAVDVREGYVAGIIEKPPGTILNAYNNAGIFIWPAEIFDMIRNLKRSPRGEYEFTDGIVRFMKRGRRLAAFELQGYWENITDPEACIRMNQNMLMEELPPEAASVGAGAEIADSAEVVNCEIAPGAVVGEGCRVEDSRLGPGCRLGSNVSMKQAEVCAGATVGDGCRIGPCSSVGEGASLGDESSLGPNASVGPNCSVGAGASIASSILLDRSSVGSGASLVHVMLDYDAVIAEGRQITGTPDRAVEVLKS